MSKFLKELIQFLALKGSVSSDLEQYITSKNPQSVSEVERLTLCYQNRGICGRL
jgi:hypothetical protein